MDHKIIVTEDAENDLDSHIRYLLYIKKDEQAARNLLDDLESTKETLSHVAASLKYCENPRLKDLGYRRIDFLNHRYFILYRLDDNVAIIDNIFHNLQDYENKMH